MWALGAYVLGLGLIALWPVPVDQGASDLLMRALRKLHRWGVPASFDYSVVELAANVILFFFPSAPSWPGSWARAVVVGRDRRRLRRLGPH